MTQALPFANLRNYLADQIEMEGSLSRWSDRHGFPKSTVSEVLSKKRDMPESMANALGFAVQKIAIPMRGQNV